METVSPATQEDSSGANPNSVKSEDSPRHGSGRNSPPPNCAICLGICRNKSFTDSCLHQFCFKCLLTWSKVKAECPLCKQNFRSIIHNVRSNHQYEEYMVEQRHEEVVERIDIDTLTTAARRFRYRTTLTLPRRESLAIQQLLLHYPLVADVMPRAAPRVRSSASFRRTVYRHNLWARPLPDFTGRFRDCSPEFYRFNDSQVHRLVPWLSRELTYLLNDNIGHISYVLARIMELLPQYHINSPDFRNELQRYFGDRTEHFVHELNCFASTPYDLTGYDRNVQYTTDSRVAAVVNEISSSDSEAESVDSDIVMVSSSEPAEPPAGPSRPPPVYPANYIPVPAPAPTPAPTPAPAPQPQPQQAPNVISIETISQSDSDDSSSEVMVVGYLKPPHERTPEVVDLVGSDSDVVLQEPEPRTPLVRLSLKRRRSAASRTSPSSLPSTRSLPEATLSDSDEDYQPRLLRTEARELKLVPLNHPLAAAYLASRPNLLASNIPSAAVTHSHSTTTSPATTPPTTPSPSDSTSWSYSPDMKRSKTLRKKSKKKSSKDVSTSSKDKKRSKKRPTRTHRKYKKSSHSSPVEKQKQSKHNKSHSGKGVKKSAKRTETNSEPSRAENATATAADQPGPSGDNSQKRKASRESTRHRSSYGSKRLRSVVKMVHTRKIALVAASSSNSSVSDSDTTDSEDNLPLNLTVQKMK